MAERFTRSEVVTRLRDQVKAGKPLLMFGAGIGLTARSADTGGADLIAIYSTAIFRMKGQSSLLAFLPYSHANDELVRMAREILPAVTRAPCIAGIGAHDPGLDLERFIDELIAMGFSGVTNEPFAGIYGPEFAGQLEAAGLGFSRELEMIKLAHRKDVFTFGWAFSPSEAAGMAEAGADAVGAIVGVTAGGATGASRTLDLDSACRAVQEMAEAAHAVNPETLVLTHGGPFKDPETARYSVTRTDAVGYASGSSGERLPTEQAVTQVTREYKSYDPARR